jgi:hypothetical protein
MYCFIDSFCDDEFRVAYGPTGGGGVVKIIFVELAIWLVRMWRGPSESHLDMIDIIFMIYFLKSIPSSCC